MKRKPGRPKGTRSGWGGFLVYIGQRYWELKHANPKLSDSEIGRILAKDSWLRRGRKAKHEAEKIRQHLKEALVHWKDWRELDDEEKAADAAYDAWLEEEENE